MPRILINSEPDNLDRTRLFELFSGLPLWELIYFDSSQDNLPVMETYLEENGVNFVLFSFKLNTAHYERITQLLEKAKLSFSIFYYSHLHFKEFSVLSESGVDACFIGRDRITALKRSLPLLWQAHWKKIPDELFEFSYQQLPPRARKIIRVIENNTLKNCNANFIAGQLQISKSHFRAEFSKYFELSFRDFKKTIFRHYESELLLKSSFKPCEVYSELSYSSLANLSRSFKARHGQTWREEISQMK